MGSRPIRKILIANRGEIALRIIRTCREMQIATVAVYSEADRGAPHVAAADEAALIGPPPSRESYLAMDRILEAAARSGADAIHPGYGFLSENGLFARRVAEEGLIFIGPRPETILAMGDKTAARSLMRAAGVPIVPGTEDAVRSVEEVEQFCAQHGFPVLLKAAAGGGGKGMRIVRSATDVRAALSAARSEALSAFGDDRVYAEVYLEGPRHIEFQIVADREGHAIHLGERECSIQRRHQKVVEETPSVLLDAALREAMGEAAVKAARACAYENAGTIEFMVDSRRRFYFLEMNTRLQVEHPVTELRTGIDLVALQIGIAQGDPLPMTQDQVRFNGHALECRICAEDVENDFLPATGRILHLKAPSGPGVREDRGVSPGGEISIYYDPMIAKLIVWAPDRAGAIARMSRALGEYELLGVPTNIPLCRFVVDHPLFAAGDFTTHFIGEHFTPEKLRRQDEQHDVYVAAAAVCARLENERASRGAVSPSPAVGGKWRSKRADFMRGQ